MYVVEATEAFSLVKLSNNNKQKEGKFSLDTSERESFHRNNTRVDIVLTNEPFIIKNQQHVSDCARDVECFVVGN